ncbi:MAG TPA: FKBP-type peptidyl-prolyl cis-trans isomerase [Vicinamibacterales bacterium]|nr:FKBP-type peptidyl-prolyl cis-trans isomerase [Vicinamibacterales bacterium]
MLQRFPRAAKAVLTAFAVASALLGAACTSPSQPSVPVEFTKIDVRVGTGAAASTGSTISVNYTGWLYDGSKADKKGEQFDASQTGRPFVFFLGASQVIAGWDQGIVGMKVGGIRRLIIPASLAYGRNGAGGAIPPNASLVFDIELLAVFN